MQNEAASLAETFEEIEKSAQEITKKIMDERDIDWKKKEKMENDLRVTEGRVKALKAAKDDLDDEVAQYTQQYDKISKQIEKSEKQAFGLQLASTIIGGITAIAGPAINALSPTAAAASVAGSFVNSSKTDQQQGQEASATGVPVQNTENNSATKNKLEESQKNAKEYTERIAAINKELAEIKIKIENETDTDKKKTLSDKQDALEKEKQDKSEKLKIAQAEAQIYQGVTNGLQYTSGKMDEMSQKAENRTDALCKNLDIIAEKKAIVSKERRATIQQLTEMTAQIANATTETRDLTIVFNALVMAVGCMRTVKVYLSDIELFWKNIAQFCGRLTEGVEEIHDKIKNSEGAEDYTIFFTAQNFVILYLINISNWVALNAISVEYLNAFNETYKKYKYEEENNNENPDPRVHWQKAKSVAQNLQEQLKIELKTGTV